LAGVGGESDECNIVSENTCWMAHNKMLMNQRLEAPKQEKVLAADREFTAILTPDLEDGGYTVTCREIPAAVSQGDTIQEALDHIVDAIELCLEAETELETGRVRAG
jgi:predicted RNase H-like HicB family nuclease